MQQPHSIPLVLNLPLSYLQHFLKIIFWDTGMHAMDLWKSLQRVSERILGNLKQEILEQITKSI